MLKSMMVACVLGLAAVGAGLENAAAQPPGVAGLRGRLANTPLGKHVSGTIGRLLVLRSELEVTPEQRSRIRATLLEYRPEIVEVAQGVVQTRRALDETVRAEQVDERAIRTAAAELGSALGDASIVRAKIVGELRGVLNEDQIEAIEAFRQEQQESVDRLLERAVAED
jgi:Spy/CpxP family protein refolding chaperone